MVDVRVADTFVLPEAFVASVVVVIDSSAFPVGMAFDPEVVVRFSGQAAHSGA